MNKNNSRKRILIIAISIIVAMVLAGVILYVALNAGEPQIMAPGPIDGPAGEDNPLLM